MSVQSGLPSVAERFAAFAVSKVREGGRLFGRTYVRIGRLIFGVGGWVFQNGGALGYGLKEYPVILGKLLGIPTKGASSYVQDVLSNLASEQLTQASGKDKNFHQLYLVPTLAEYGCELTLESKEWVDKKVYDEEMIYNFAQFAFQKGVAVGFHFPKEFRIYWDNTYRQRSSEEWAEMYKRGIVSTPEQDILKLQEEVSVALTSAADWVRVRVPTQLTPRELSTLDKLAVT